MKEVTLRGYYWAIQHLSPIQQGVQNTHSNNEIFATYPHGSPEQGIFIDWVKNHKTAIFLARPSCAALREVAEEIRFLNSKLRNCFEAHDFLGVTHVPVATFEEPDLDNIITSVFAVVPSSMFFENYIDRKQHQLVIEPHLNEHGQFVMGNTYHKKEEFFATLVEAFGSESRALEAAFRAVISKGSLSPNFS